MIFQNKDDIDKLIENLVYTPEIISRFETGLELDFVPQKISGNLCFANDSDELRDDFKQTFTSIDLSNYFYAVLYSQTYQKRKEEVSAIDFFHEHQPKGTETFWKLSRLGEKIRETYQSENSAVENNTSISPEIQQLRQEIDKIELE